MNRSADFTFVTYRDLPDLDPDDRLAVDLLADRGFCVASAVWDDPEVRWSEAGICVIRSTWDYNRRHYEFLDWAGRVSAVAPLYNSLAIVRWNSHKKYLADLEARGVPTVPTRWLSKGAAIKIGDILDFHNWDRAVAKPAVGLATYGVKVVDGSPGSQAHVNELLRQHDVMVQPYIESVDTYGERALVFINGTYSHAARKTAFQILARAGEAGETAVDATGAEIAVGVAAMRALPAATLYGRVDLVAGDDGKPLVIEVELIEPSLFLGMHPRAASRFADALCAMSPRQVG